METKYFPETDTLHIILTEDIRAESEEVYENVIFNFNAEGKVISITIDPASEIVDIARIKPHLKKKSA